MNYAAHRYLSGEWENEVGWVTLKDPYFVDLRKIGLPAIRTTVRQSLRNVSMHRFAAPCLPTYEEVSWILRVHADRWGDFNWQGYANFLEREARVLDATSYILRPTKAALPSEVLGVSFNFAYKDEDLVVAQLFAWDKDRYAEYRLGATDFQLQAAWFAALGYRYFALGEFVPYKDDLFRKARCSP